VAGTKSFHGGHSITHAGQALVEILESGPSLVTSTQAGPPDVRPEIPDRHLAPKAGGWK
jgi:hypothetical protein